MTVTGFIAYAQGWGGLYIRANKLAYEQMKKHPGLGIPNARGIPDVPERVHWDDELARDDGFVERHSCRIRHHNVVDDWLRITGTVVAKDVAGDTVTVEQRAVNQHGE